MKTPITYYGGKQALLKYLLPLIHPHTIYCEPFFGGGALFFAKPKSDVEIINDLNSEVINFFKVVQTKFPELEKEIKGSLHSRELYKKAMVVYKNPDMFDDVKRAWALWVATNQGFSSLIGSWGFGKTDSKEAAVANKRENFTTEYADRLKSAQIENNDALKVIDRADSKDTFFYVDPPYINSDQGHYEGYTEENYDDLLKRLSKIKGKFLLSSYPSKLLNQYIKKFKWKVQTVKKSVAVTKLTDKIKTEVMVMNYDPTLSNQREMKSKKAKKALSGIDNPYKEIHYIQWFLSFHNKTISRSDVVNFLDELQTDIVEKEIRKNSPFAKHIMKIQDALVNLSNQKRLKYKTTIDPVFKKELETIFKEEKEKKGKQDDGNAKSIELSGVETKQTEPSSVNVMCSTDFVKIAFDRIGFTDKWLELIGDPAPGFTAMVYGKPKMGKSYLCVDFAGYLAKNFGKVLYVAGEEKLYATLQDKIKEKTVDHENFFVADGLPKDLSPYKFIFLDSVNLLGLKPEDLRHLKLNNPDKSFVYVFQTTKTGNFKGANSFQHDVDVVIQVPEIGKAVQFGRFNQGGEMQIFDDELVKN